MFERYTEKARRVIFFARYEASQFGSPCIDTEHLLLGMLREDTAIAKRLLRPPLTIEFIRKRIEEQKLPGEKVSTSVDMPLSAGCKRVLAFAAEEAKRLSDNHIGTNHLLLGLVKERDGLAAKVLSEVGVDTSEFRDEIGRMSDASWKVAQPQKPKWEDYFEIHGELWGANSVRELGEYYRKFHWEKRQCVARDALLFRSTAGLYFYTGQPFDSEKADLLKGGWSEDHCVICWWKLCGSDSPEHAEAYTNGQDWLCVECYNRFVSPERPGS
jgi:ATP-dependent Clp protease ATP-binding subunit ClpA